MLLLLGFDATDIQSHPHTHIHTYVHIYTQNHTLNYDHDYDYYDNKKICLNGLMTIIIPQQSVCLSLCFCVLLWRR